MAVLGLWYWSEGSGRVGQHAKGRSLLLGGDYSFTDIGHRSRRLDRRHRRPVFGAGLAVAAALYYWPDVSCVLLFWTAFILPRPLGATLGDFLDQPLRPGGLALSPTLASL